MHAMSVAQDRDINQVVADALRFWIDRQGWSVNATAKKAGLSEGTLRLYLRPYERRPGATGKVASGKLAELAEAAEVLAAAQ